MGRKRNRRRDGRPDSLAGMAATAGATAYFVNGVKVPVQKAGSSNPTNSSGTPQQGMAPNSRYESCSRWEPLDAAGLLTFGKHVGKGLRDVPAGWMVWMTDQDIDDGFFRILSDELDRREVVKGAIRGWGSPSGITEY